MQATFRARQRCIFMEEKKEKSEDFAFVPLDFMPISNPEQKEMVSGGKRGKGIHYSKAQRQWLITQCVQLDRKGEPAREIAKRLHLNIKTVYNYLNGAAKEEYALRLKNNEMLLNRWFGRVEARIKELTEQANAARNRKDWTTYTALSRQLNDLITINFDKLQSAGLIDKVKEQVEHSGLVEVQEFVKEFWTKKKVASEPITAEQKK